MIRHTLFLAANLFLLAGTGLGQTCGPISMPGGVVTLPAPVPSYPLVRQRQFIPNPGYHFSGIGGTGSTANLFPPTCGLQPISPGWPCGPRFVAPSFPVCPTPLPAPTFPCGNTGWVSGGSGLTVGGVFTNDRWKIGFRIGSPVACVTNICGPTFVPPVCISPLWGWTNTWGAYWGSYYPYAMGPNTYGNDPRLWKSSEPVQTQPVAQPAAPAEPPTPLEVGKAALAEKQPRVAIAAFRRDIAERGSSPDTLRFLAIALVENKQLEDASAVMAAAYRLDTLLASIPIDLSGLGYSQREFRDLTTRCVHQANRLGTASSWLLVASLMQAEGRNEPAQRAIEKAAKYGLDSGLVDVFSESLKSR